MEWDAPRVEPGHEQEVGDVLDAAWGDLGEGRPADALARVAGLDPDEGERHLIETQAHAELGAPGRARAALSRAERSLAADDPGLLWARAELELAEGHGAEARATFESIPGGGDDPLVIARRALCADLEEDWAAADALHARAAALDPDGFPRPPRLAPEAFDEVIRASIEALPAELIGALERVNVVVDPMPPSERHAELGPELLGLFVGGSLLDASDGQEGELPPSVYLYQRNLERYSRDVAELTDQIRVTLFHELGHALGFDEQGVAEMGLE